MGYILEVRGVDVAAMLNAVQSIDATTDLSTFDDMPDAAYDSLDDVVAFLAERATDQSVEATASPEVADLIAGIARHHSYWWGAIQHTSSGGTDFRTELAEEAAPLLGQDFVLHLVTRPVAGIHFQDHPFVGWVSAAEVANALDRAARQGIPRRQDQSDALRTLLDACEQAAKFELGLVTIYD